MTPKRKLAWTCPIAIRFSSVLNRLMYKKYERDSGRKCPHFNIARKAEVHGVHEETVRTIKYVQISTYIVSDYNLNCIFLFFPPACKHRRIHRWNIYRESWWSTDQVCCVQSLLVYVCVQKDNIDSNQSMTSNQSPKFLYYIFV